MKTAFFIFFSLMLLSTLAKAQQSFNSLNVTDLNVNGNIQVVSTTESSKPCPSMTEAQRDALTPTIGHCVYNSDALQLNVYDGSDWQLVGGGGGINNWLTATDYEVDAVVIQNSKIYQCLITHTSGTFATDLAASRWAEVSAGLTGIIGFSNGGTAKALTASNGSIAYSDTDSFELLAPGTSGQILQTNGAAAPTFVNKSISGKAENNTAITLEEIQAPNNQLTQTDTNKHLLETGNANILANPNFEHSTFSTSWTLTAGSSAVETTIVVSGKKSYKATLSAQTLDLYQDSTLYASQFAGTVQGVAMVRVRSTVSGIFVCPRQAGATQLSNCAQVDNSGTWGLYKVPFVLGATSNGIAIVSGTISNGLVTVGNVTGDVYVDDAKVEAGDIIDTQPTIGPWVAFTPTGSWTANTTYTGFYRQVGTNYEYSVDLAITGTPTTASLSINLPSGHVIDTTKLAVSSASVTGSLGYGSGQDVGTGNFGASVFYKDTTSVYVSSFMTGGANSSGQATINQGNPMVWANGDKLVLFFTVPISGLQGSTNTYTSSCGANCVDILTAKISTTPAVTTENVSGWISSVSRPGTGEVIINFKTSLFTVAPSVTCAAITNSVDASCSVDTAATTSSVRVQTMQNGAATDLPVEVIVAKQGADFTATRTIVGSFKDVDTSPGVSKPKTCYYAFGGSSATLTAPTECTSGTCVEVYDSCNAVTPPAWATAAFYNDITFASGTFANSSPINCTCTAYDTTSVNPRTCVGHFVTSDNTWASNSTGGAVLNYIGYDTGGVPATIYATLKCTGSAP